MEGFCYEGKAKRGGDLEEGTVGALSPQALGARFVLAVRLVDLQVLHLRRKQHRFDTRLAYGVPVSSFYVSKAEWRK